MAQGLLSSCAHAPPILEWELCPGYHVRGRIEPGLGETEKRLVCGDPSTPEWSRLPRWQSEFNFRNFLQDRGLYDAKFIEHEHHEVNGHYVREIEVDVGVPTRVNKITLVGAPESIDISKRRFIMGEVMTPSILSEIEGWVSGRLKNQGFPCPKVKSEADPHTGEVIVHVETGPLLNIVRVQEQTISGMDPGVLRRFDAFGFGDPYREDLLTLSADRITRLGLFDSVYFLSSCEPDGAVVRENVVDGPPRLFTFGAGIDTEGIISGRASWSNARLGRKASLLTTSISASSKIQQGTTSLDWYVFGPSERKSLRPSFTLLHDNEDFYEIAQASANFYFQRNWEWDIARGIFLIGPQFQYVHTFRGTGPPNSRFLFLSGQFEIMSHNFELYLNEPRTGYDFSFSAGLSKEGVVTSASAQQFGFRYDGLWNIGGFDPPLFIFGWRGAVNTTLTPSAQLQQGIEAMLPPSFTYFLGGSTNLRGFGRQSLPGNGIGGLTSVFSGIETRLVRVLPLDFEPFVFMDAGALGPLPGTLREPIYYSPGFGVRWSPAFGAFRSTLARGYPLDAPGGLQFYFSFGEEF